ncbi:hypothetical protein F5883DRAFT_710502 [Diaporthe sp. PMI_573]|nr:hypothetical protein F5883DRAFT_710502 [Diaporthaceae sp. PMI_573]
MTGNMILALFSALAGAALASGHDLGVVELDRRLYGYEPEPEPASWCFTYYSYYLAPLETPYPLPGPPVPGPLEIILAIIPTVFGRSLGEQRLGKRDLGGFISDVGSPNPKDCRSATIYRLDSARLQLSSRASASIFADAGTSFTEFRSHGSLNAGANVVATTFLDDNSVLRWRNASFSGGEAGFCQVPATRQVQPMRGWQYHVDLNCRQFYTESWASFFVRPAANYT